MIEEPTDAALIKTTLITAADSGVELRHPLFARWFAAWPDRRATFLNADASSWRMTDETLEMMLGLAKGEELTLLIQAARVGWDVAIPGHILGC